jgi:hypothetical protein
MKKPTPREWKSDPGHIKPLYQLNQSIWGTRLSLVMYCNAKTITPRLAPMQLGVNEGPLWISQHP